MFQNLPFSESLEHVALPDELAEYRQLRQGGMIFDISSFGLLGGPRLTGLRQVLWLRAREHLLSGKWDARAFQDNDTAKQKWLHRDIWYFLEPDRSLTRVTGGGFDFCGILVSGQVSSLIGIGNLQPELDAGNTDPTAGEHLEDGDAPTRARLYHEIKALFERLDGELPLHECKPTFFARAREELGSNLSDYILLQVWGNAEVNSERRKPGVRKQI
jgi:hypothetical protein